MSLVFYHQRTSLCCVKTRLALNEKGLAYEGHILDLRAGDQFDPAYLALNPKAEVPTLVHDGDPIVESTVINEYLDEAFPDPPLAPREPKARARMRVWTKKPDEGGHFANAALSFALSHRHLIKDRSPEAVEAHLARVPDPARRERQRAAIILGLDAPGVVEAAAWFERMFAEMERVLEDGPWLAGETYSLADIALTPYVTRLDMSGMAGFWAGRRPRVADWYARARARPSHRRTIIDEGDPKVFALLAEHAGRERDTIEALIARVAA